jgi:hypothetical protein
VAKELILVGHISLELADGAEIRSSVGREYQFGIPERRRAERLPKIQRQYGMITTCIKLENMG